MGNHFSEKGMILIGILLVALAGSIWMNFIQVHQIRTLKGELASAKVNANQVVSTAKASRAKYDQAVARVEEKEQELAEFSHRLDGKTVWMAQCRTEEGQVMAKLCAAGAIADRDADLVVWYVDDNGDKPYIGIKDREDKSVFNHFVDGQFNEKLQNWLDGGAQRSKPDKPSVLE